VPELVIGGASADITLSLALPDGYIWEDDITGDSQNVIVISYVGGNQGEYALPTYNENEEYGWQRFIYTVELVTDDDTADGDGFLVPNAIGRVTTPVSGVVLQNYDAETAVISYTSYSYKSTLEEKVTVRPYLAAGARITATGNNEDVIAPDGLSAQMYIYNGNTITITDKRGESKTYVIALNMPWKFTVPSGEDIGYSEPRLIVNGVQTPLFASETTNSRDIAAGTAVGLTVTPQSAGLAIDSVTLKKLRSDTVYIGGDLNILGNTVYFTMPDECVAVESITFGADTRTLYTIDAQSSKYTQYDDMGAVTVTEAGASYGLTQAEAGSTLSASATPNSSSYLYEFEFVKWEAEGVALDSYIANPAVFQMPAGNVSLTAVFEKSGVEVKYGASIRGAATITPRALIGTSTEISRDTVVTDVIKSGALIHFARSNENLTVYAFEGYFDENGTEHVADADGYIEIGSEPMTVIARYRARVARRLTAAIDTESLGMGSVGVRLNGVASATDGMAVEGQSVTLTATPAPRYKFKEWKIVSAPEGFALYPGAGNEIVTFTMPAHPISVKAIFERDETQMSGENVITYMELTDNSGNQLGETWRVGQNWKIILPADTSASTLNNLAALKLTVSHSEYATVQKSGGYDDAQGDEKWSDGVVCGLALDAPAEFIVTAENGETRTYTLTVAKEAEAEPPGPEDPGNPKPNNPGVSTGNLSEDQLVALESLQRVFESCPRGEYTDAEWSQLTGIYERGQRDIEEASDYAAIQRALAEAAEDMTGVTASLASPNMTVAVTLEKFAIDGTYIVEPILVTAPRGTRASAVITNVIKDKYPGVAQPWKMTGSVEKDFYLSYVWDPTYVENPAQGGASWKGYLGEFDEGPDSGWMFCVNNSFPGVGAAAWTLRNGDVMRWQYTREGLGSDIGSDNTAWQTGASVPVANKDALTWRIAEINTNEKKADYGASYSKAILVLSKISSTQAEVDAALSAIRKGGGNTDASGDEGSLVAAPEITEDIIVKAEVAGAGAIAEIDSKDVKTAINDAANKGSTAVAIIINDSGEASSISCVIPKNSVDEIKYAGLKLIVKTDISEITFDQASLDTIGLVSGDTVTLTAATVDNAEALNTKQQDKVGDNPVVELNISVGDTAITSFGGSVTVSVPYTPSEDMAEDDYDLQIFTKFCIREF
jgi:hypothetical protein